MPPALETNTPAHIANRRLVYLILVLGLCIIMAATFFWFHSREEQTSATQPTPVTLVPFSSNLVLSLTAPVKDTEGIPYSGLVHFDPDTNRYSYLASSDEIGRAHV